MTEPAVRLQYRYNRMLQYWSPCTHPRSDPFEQIALTRHASPPERWPECVVDALDRVREARVGRAVIRHIRLRTTFYPGAAPQADVDLNQLNDASATGVQRTTATHRARTVGFPAQILIDPNLSAYRSTNGLLQVTETGLVHELFHAMNITQGCSRLGGNDDVSQRCRAPSTEEAYAVVIENMFRSEMHYCARRTYFDLEPVAYCAAPTSANSGIPLTALERRMVLFYRTHVSMFAGELAAIPEAACRYNPFRVVRREPAPRLGERSST